MLATDYEYFDIVIIIIIIIIIYLRIYFNFDVLFLFYFMCDIFYIIRHLLGSGPPCAAAGGCSCPSSDGSGRSDGGVACDGGVADDDTSDPNSFGSAGHSTDEHSLTISDIS